MTSYSLLVRGYVREMEQDVNSELADQNISAMCYDFFSTPIKVLAEIQLGPPFQVHPDQAMHSWKSLIYDRYDSV